MARAVRRGLSGARLRLLRLSPLITLGDRHIPDGPALPQLHGIGIFGRSIAIEGGCVARKLHHDHARPRLPLLWFCSSAAGQKSTPYLPNALPFAAMYSLYPSGSLTSANTTQYPIAI